MQQTTWATRSSNAASEGIWTQQSWWKHDARQLMSRNKHMFKHSSTENLFPDFIQVHVSDSSNITNVLYDVCTRCLVEKKHQSSTIFFWSSSKFYIYKTSKNYIKTSKFYFASLIFQNQTQPSFACKVELSCFDVILWCFINVDLWWRPKKNCRTLLFFFPPNIVYKHRTKRL